MQHEGMVPRCPAWLENKGPEEYLQSPGLISPGQSSAGYCVCSDVPRREWWLPTNQHESLLISSWYGGLEKFMKEKKDYLT